MSDCDLEWVVFYSILFSPGEEVFEVLLYEYFTHIQLHASLSVVVVLVQTSCISWYEQDALELHLRGDEKRRKEERKEESEERREDINGK